MQSNQQSMIFRSPPPPKRPVQKAGPKFKLGAVEIFIIAAIVAGGAGYLFATPYITLMMFKKAIANRDSEGVSKYVDYGSLRESIKRQIYEQMARGRKSDGKVPLASVIYADIAESAVDWAVNPQGIALMMGDLHAYDQPWDNTSEGTKKLFERGEKSPEMRGIMDRYRKKPDAQELPVKKEPTKLDTALKEFTVTRGWASLDTFAVKISCKTDSAQVTRLFFVRKGLKWTLSAASIPPDKSLERLAEESEKEPPARTDPPNDAVQAPEPEGTVSQGN